MLSILHVYSVRKESETATTSIICVHAEKMEVKKMVGIGCWTTRLLMLLCGGLLGLGGLFPLLLLEVVHVDLDDVGVLDHKPIQILGLHLYSRRKEKRERPMKSM